MNEAPPRHRRAETPRGEEAPLFDPRRQSWEEHFGWDHDATHVAGLTPTGRATVAALRLNRKKLVAFRLLLRDAGQHPPVEPASSDEEDG